MAVIRVIHDGPCTIRIHDDFILDEEGKKKALKEIARIAYEALYEQEMERIMKGEQQEQEKK